VGHRDEQRIYTFRSQMAKVEFYEVGRIGAEQGPELLEASALSASVIGGSSPA
jgi:hypothetical protein